MHNSNTQENGTQDAASDQSAFVLRIAHGTGDLVKEALAANQIIIGWAEADGLLAPALDWPKFREIIRRKYYQAEPNFRRVGAAAGHMWRFIREMKPADLVVVPYGTDFFVAEVAGPAEYDRTKVKEDSAYRRPVRWRNDKKPIPRRTARSALISRMKIQGTSADATDLLDEIRESLNMSTAGEAPTFQTALQNRLAKEALAELRNGHLDSFGFERLIQSTLRALGAHEVRIIPRNQDKGADLVATFLVAGAFQLTVAVQAKHWSPKPPVGRDVVLQLIHGIEAESADLGMVVTTGSISDEASKAADEYFEDKGIRIELVDGEQFAKLLIEHVSGTP